MTLPERLGSFYLGKAYDLAKNKLMDRPVLYDARDLTTHAVCLGMTGSGKTGLCIDLLEEAAIDKVPVLIIDPKGDMTNLLLTFPELAPGDFRPWVNLDDARRKGMTPDEYAAKTAETWRKGLAEWDQGPERIRLLRDSASFTIFTPGSDAGTPVSVLSSLKAPALSFDDHAESLRERINGTVSALLGLAGVDSDPLLGREHILLSTIFEHAWRDKTDLSMASLIRAIQEPPVRQLGVFDVETFFPARDRFELAMRLNAIIAAPGFAPWLTGAPLDIDSLLHEPDGRPRVSIFSIAHLSHGERMFFVTLLLEQVVSWMRSQSGTTSLRALLYMDEVFGFFPPVAEPPSKKPLLTLLKQARAFGLGVVLTTQNPVDLDYKGLTNAGTWFIGKLQAERDKARVLEGLETIADDAGKRPDRRELDRIISSLGSRVFLMHNVHADGPEVFMTRWAMSYLRGPLTRMQIRDLTAFQRRGLDAKPSSPDPRSGRDALPPSLPPDLDVVYLPSGAAEAAGRRYRAGVIGVGTVHFVDNKRDVDQKLEVLVWCRAGESLASVRWDACRSLDLAEDDLRDAPEPGIPFADPPHDLGEIKGLEKRFSDHLYRTMRLPLMYNPVLKLYSKPGEDERTFKAACLLAAREKRDAELDALSDRFQDRMDRIREKIRREELELEEDQADYEARKREELVSAGESLLGFFLGRRSSRSLSTAARRRRMTMRAKQDIQESEETLTVLNKEIQELERELTQVTEEVGREWDAVLEELEMYEVKPRRSDVVVRRVALAWRAEG